MQKVVLVSGEQYQRKSLAAGLRRPEPMSTARRQVC